MNSHTTKTFAENIKLQKKEEINQLRSLTDLIAMQEETGFSPDLIRSAFEPSKTKRRTYLRNIRKQHNSFPVKKQENSKAVHQFKVKEQELIEKFHQISHKNEILVYILFLSKVEEVIPGSGLLHTVVRHVGRIFFQKSRFAYSVASFSKKDLETRSGFVSKI